MIKPRIILAALAAGTFVIAGCSADSTDFKKAAEKAINDEDTFDDAECVKPDSSKVDTTFPCTATEVETGLVVEFTAEIVSDKRVEVTPIGYADDAATGDTTPADEETEETTGS